MNFPVKKIVGAMWLAVCLSLFVVTPVSAATTFSLESVDIGLGSADLKQSVVNIVNLALGLLSLVAVVMIIIGGFTWLTSGGNEEKVDQAKKTISAAIIGIVIVLLAWAIVLFVGNTTANVTLAP